MNDGNVWKKSQIDSIVFEEKSFWEHKEPTIIPEKAETPTANVAIYNVIRVLSQYSDNAIKRIKLPTIKQDLIPPIIYPAPINKTKVDTTGILRYACFIGPRTLVNKKILNPFK